MRNLILVQSPNEYNTRSGGFRNRFIYRFTIQKKFNIEFIVLMCIGEQKKSNLTFICSFLIKENGLNNQPNEYDIRSGGFRRTKGKPKD